MSKNEDLLCVEKKQDQSDSFPDLAHLILREDFVAALESHLFIRLSFGRNIPDFFGESLKLLDTVREDIPVTLL